MCILKIFILSHSAIHTQKADFLTDSELCTHILALHCNTFIQVVDMKHRFIDEK